MKDQLSKKYDGRISSDLIQLKIDGVVVDDFKPSEPSYQANDENTSDALNVYSVEDNPEDNTTSFVIIRASIKSDGLLGGKGGFGAMLRAQAKQKGAKTTTGKHFTHYTHHRHHTHHTHCTHYTHDTNDTHCTHYTHYTQTSVHVETYPADDYDTSMVQ